MSRGGWIIACVASLAPLQAPCAQEHGSSDALIRWQQELASRTDTATLRQLEREKIEIARGARDSAFLHLELGLLALRLGELGGRHHFDDAISEFEWAAELEPRWAWPWYGVGLAEEAIGDSRVSPIAGVQAMIGRDGLTRAADAMREALAREPGFGPALEALSRLALTQRVNVRLEPAVSAHRRAAGSNEAAGADVLLARGRVERLAGSPDSALAAFRAFAAAGGSPPVAYLEEARTLFVLDSLSGAEPYYSGAAVDDPVAVAMYRGDLEPIATDSALAAFDLARGSLRAAFLADFWRERDQYDLRTSGERLMEHYRRLHLARLRYRLAVTRRRFDTDERYRDGGEEVDDRGVIYIRHGEPTDSATFVALDACRNLTWSYQRPEGDLLFHFVARDDVSDFRLVESLMDIADAGGIRRTHQVTCEPSPRSDLALSRAPLDPAYLRLAHASPNQYSQLVQAERMRGQRAIIIGTTTDRYPLAFADSLDARAEVAAVGTGPGGEPVLHIAFALRGATVEAVPSAAGPSYPVRTRLSVVDSSGKVVAAVDTMKVFVPRTTLTPDGFLVGRMTVPVPPGTVRWRFALDQEGTRGQVFAPRVVRVADPGAGFALSDLALGAPGLSAEWTSADGEAVRLNPLGAWRSGSDMDLYAEVYGIESGAPFAVELTVTRLGGGGFLGLFGGGRKRSLTLSSTEVSRGVASPIRKTVTLTDLAPGQYRLRLLVRDAAGRVAERERGLLVRPRSAPTGR